MSAEIEANHLVFMRTGSIRDFFSAAHCLDTILEIVILRTHTEANLSFMNVASVPSVQLCLYVSVELNLPLVLTFHTQVQREENKCHLLEEKHVPFRETFWLPPGVQMCAEALQPKL